MKTTTHFRQVLTLLLTLAAMAVGQTEAWASNWTVTASTSGMTTTFTIKRNNPTTTETVYYRTVNSSAVANVHYTPVSGTLTFNENDSVLTVEVNEETPSIVAPAFRYQVYRTSRSYDFQVLNRGGNLLCSCSSGRDYRSYSFSRENDLFIKLYNFYQYTVAEGPVTVTDGGYTQAYHAVPLDEYFNVVPRDLLTAFNAQLDFFVDFEACEVSDGWQYVQILVNNPTTCDSGAGDGAPGTISKSFYMAGFEHDHGSANPTYAYYRFPVYNIADNAGGTTPWNSEGNTIGNLHLQKFKSGYRSDGGYLLLPIDLITSLGIRFNASGSGNDDWTFKNLVANFQAYDRQNPTLHSITSLRYSVSPGPYIKGAPFYVSVAFNVPVTYDSSLRLQTSWGPATCNSNTQGTNVLTFSGNIDADVGTPLEVTGYTGTIHGIHSYISSGNNIYRNFTGTISKSFSNAIVTACPHSWSEPTYTWTDDNSQVTAYRKCEYNCGAEEQETVATTSVTTAATCLSAGSTTYTATFTNPAFETQTKDAEIPALGHEPGTPGYTWFLLENQWQCQGKRLCTRCGVLADVDDGIVTSAVTREPTCGDWGETTWTATFTKEGYTTQTHTHENIPPTYQHTWGEPTYTWDTDIVVHYGKCTASRECSVCHETESEDGALTNEQSDVQTCTLGAGDNFTATFTNPAFETQTQWSGYGGYGPLGHQWQVGNPQWGYGNTTCSITRHCVREGCGVDETYWATVTNEWVYEATCTTAGSLNIIASFPSPFDIYDETLNFQMPALGHEYDTDPVWTWAADYSSATATFTCSRCHETQDYATTNITQEENTYTATVTLNGTTYTDTQNVLHVGSNIVHVPGNGEYVYYTFTAPANGWYHIWSEGSPENLVPYMPTGNGGWSNVGYNMDNDFTILQEMTAGTTNTFRFYTWNAADVTVFVKKAETHTVTLVQPADGSIKVYDNNTGTEITDTDNVMEGTMVRLCDNFGASPTQSVIWTVTDADGQPVKGYTYFTGYDTYTYFFMPDKDVTVTATLNNYLFLDDASTDNSSTLEDLDNNHYSTMNVCIGRTLYKDGSWNTLCLPFDVEDIADSPLAGATVKELDWQTSKMTGTHVHLAFIDAGTTLKKGVPYIIKWENSGYSIVNPVFNNVNITPWTNPQWAADGYTEFVGYYDAWNIYPADSDIYYMTADNTLKHTAKKRTLKGFRAYFRFFPNDNDSVKPLTFDIDFGDDEATGIHDMDEVLSTKYNEVYDLSGRRVSTPTKGLYIINGKKVFIK